MAESPTMPTLAERQQKILYNPVAFVHEVYQSVCEVVPCWHPEMETTLRKGLNGLHDAIRERDICCAQKHANNVDDWSGDMATETARMAMELGAIIERFRLDLCRHAERYTTPEVA